MEVLIYYARSPRPTALGGGLMQFRRGFSEWERQVSQRHRHSPSSSTSPFLLVLYHSSGNCRHHARRKNCYSLHNAVTSGPAISVTSILFRIYRLIIHLPDTPAASTSTIALLLRPVLVYGLRVLGYNCDANCCLATLCVTCYQ